MDFSDRLSQANGRLRTAQIRVRVQQVGQRLYLRSTLPPPPGSVKDRPYQQRIALNLPANPRGLSVAEQKARELGVSLENGSFDWGAWRGSQAETVGEWVERFCTEWEGSPLT